MTATMPTTTKTEMLPVYFTPPLVQPAGGGLAAVTSWTDETGPPRWLAEGVAFRAGVTGNFGGDDSTGIWGASWCVDPDDLTSDDYKDSTRPDDPDAFTAVTAWGFDSCDLTAPAQAEVIDRAQQVLAMREPGLIAREFADRILTDAGTATSVSDLAAAIAEAEDALAADNVIGFIHAGPKVLPALVTDRLAARDDAGVWRTPGGHVLVVDGGYRSTLGADTLVVTSQPFGWRNQVEVRTTEKLDENTFVALAERSTLIGVEAVLGAAKVTT